MGAFNYESVISLLGPGFLVRVNCASVCCGLEHQADRRDMQLFSTQLFG